MVPGRHSKPAACRIASAVSDRAVHDCEIARADFMRYLVTGGTGFIGSALVKRLAADGQEVRVLDDMSRGRKDRLCGVNCEIVNDDVREPAAVVNAVRGCDSVIHLAYFPGTHMFYISPRQLLDGAVRGITNVLSACEQTGVSELLLVSSSEVYQVPTMVPTNETVPLAVPDPLNPRHFYRGGQSFSWVICGALAPSRVFDPLVLAPP